MLPLSRDGKPITAPKRAGEREGGKEKTRSKQFKANTGSSPTTESPQQVRAKPWPAREQSSRNRLATELTRPRVYPGVAGPISLTASAVLSEKKAISSKEFKTILQK